MSDYLLTLLIAGFLVLDLIGAVLIFLVLRLLRDNQQNSREDWQRERQVLARGMERVLERCLAKDHPGRSAHLADLHQAEEVHRTEVSRPPPTPTPSRPDEEILFSSGDMSPATV